MRTHPRVPLLFVALCCVSSPATHWVHAGVEVHASGNFGEVGAMSDDDAGDESANASVTNVSDYLDSFSASASASSTTFRAKAQASCAADNGIGAVGNATVRWTDTLTLSNPDLLAAYGAGTVFLYFAPVATGQGRYGKVVFHATLTPAAGEVVSGEKQATFGAATLSSALRVGLQMDPHEFSPAAGVNFTIDLAVETDNTMPKGYSANVDFSRTTTMPPIFVGDANGKPVPGLAGLNIKGSSGKTYAVTIVPDVPVLTLSRGSWPWQLSLSWNTARDNCVLESSPTMLEGSWTPVVGPQIVNGLAHSQTANAELDKTFFRLRCPE
jgi:hypothetical protein